MRLTTKSTLAAGLPVMGAVFGVALVASPAFASTKSQPLSTTSQKSRMHAAAAPASTLTTNASCSNPGLYFDGMDTAIISTQGAQADISRYDPRICESSSIWSMMDNQTTATSWPKLGG